MAASLAYPAALVSRRKKSGHRFHKFSGIVGDEEMLARRRSGAFGAERGGNDGDCSRPGFQDLETGTAPGQQGDHRDPGLRQSGDGVRDGTDELYSGVASYHPVNGVGILAEDAPREVREALAQGRPDFGLEETNGRDVGLIFEIAGEHDALGFGAWGLGNLRKRVGVDRDERAGPDGP